jgi:L-lactate dehydrogenase complex protein LldE
MRVGLFVPCYVDQLRPQVGLAALALLEQQGLDVVFPAAQTCCGQPLLNAGSAREARALAARFLDVFAGFDHVVCPSASCVATVVHHYRDLLGASPGLDAVAARTHELCAFLVGVLGVDAIAGRFPHRVGLHGSCHALRQLRHGPASERIAPPAPDPLRKLLASLDGIRFAELARKDECCGFGGIFAVEEEAVSRRMGLDRLDDHARGGAEVITSTDVSCLLHLEGLARRQGRGPRLLHAAEILAEATAACGPARARSAS